MAKIEITPVLFSSPDFKNFKSLPKMDHFMTREAKHQNFQMSGANDGTSEQSKRVAGHGNYANLK